MVITILLTKLRSHVGLLEKGGATLYYKCQWENKRREVSLTYLSYRWLHFVTIVFCLLISLLNNEEGHLTRWPIYLTNWSLLLCFVQALLGAFIVTKVYYCIRKGVSMENSGKYLEIYGELQTLAVVIALGVTLVYWCFVHNPAIHKMNLVNITSHICNSFIMLLDLFMVAHPIKLVDMIFPLSFTLIYTVFNFIYFLSGGTDRKGNPFVYKAMDWRKPFHALLFVHGGFVILIILFLFVWAISIIRRSISYRFETTHDLVPQQDPSFELSSA